MSTPLRNQYGEPIRRDEVVAEIRAKLDENPHLTDDRARVDALAEYIIRDWALDADVQDIALLIYNTRDAVRSHR